MKAAVGRLSGFMADAIFLAQLAAPVGLLLWVFGGQSDGAGFAMIAGAAAGLIAFFAFAVFAALSWLAGAAGFWSTLHPLNIALPMLVLAGFRMAQREQWGYGALAAAVGFLLAAVCSRWFSGRPRAQLSLCIGLLLLLLAAARWRYGTITGASGGVFVLTLWLQHNVPRLRPAG